MPDTAPDFDLAGVNAFEGLSAAQIAEAMREAGRRTFAAGEVIFEEGDASDGLFIIERGSCAVKKLHRDRTVTVAMLSPGAVFGEVGLLNGRPRTATVIAASELEVHELPRAAFEALTERGGPEVARLLKNLAKISAERLDRMNTALAEHIEQAERERQRATELKAMLERPPLSFSRGDRRVAIDMGHDAELGRGALFGITTMCRTSEGWQLVRRIERGEGEANLDGLIESLEWLRQGSVPEMGEDTER